MSAVITGQLPNEIKMNSMNIQNIILAITNGELTNEPRINSVKQLTKSVSCNYWSVTNLTPKFFSK